jgi:protocatechuate 3,4-dioxygenase beta subunit
MKNFLFTFLVFAVLNISQSFAQDAANEETTAPPPQIKTVNEYKSTITNLEKETPLTFEPRRPTPSRFFTADLSMPDTFAPTNNLAKKVGSFYRAFGEIIFIQGTVTDSFGVPIDGVKIEIWQTNAAGKYHTLLEPGSEYIDKFFSMSGRTITDNLGSYHFITIMPGSSPGRAPHINMNLYHEKFGKLSTEMYFENHPYNITDYQYLSYDETDRKLVTALVRSSDIMNPQSIKLCTFDIVLKGTQQYKRY